MKRQALAIYAVAALACLLAMPDFSAAGEHGHSMHHGGQEVVAPIDASSAPEKESAHDLKRNPLVEEMRVLDSSFREIVSAVAVGSGDRVHKAIEAMHGRMERTQEAVHSGEVKVPKNATRLNEFVRLDKDFHSDLERLAHSAEKGDNSKMLLFTKKLMDGCIRCHSIFKR